MPRPLRSRTRRARPRSRTKAAAAAASRRTGVELHPATPDRWADVVRVFGPRGACAGCWCMWWRLPHAQWRAQRGDRNRRALQRLVQAGPPPGLLAYVEGEPAGWCAVAPRAEYVRLSTSRILQPVDERPVWAVTCFFVVRKFRGRGLLVALLRAAAQFASARGATAIEGYPSEPTGRQADSFVYTGLASAFRRAGFREVARRSPTRPIMRLNSIP